jgi:hypothetical protein
MTRIRRRNGLLPERPGADARAGRGPRALIVGVLVPLLVGALGAGSAASAAAAPPAPAQVAPAVKKPLSRARQARALKALPSRPAGGATPAAASNHGPTSPYARATAQRADSGLPPPGHPQVSQHAPLEPVAKPVQ